VRIRSLALLPVLALLCLAVAGCDSKAGSAAVVEGRKISETQLNGYLTPSAKPIPANQGNAVPARLFVLRTLIRNVAFTKLLEAAGVEPTAQQLAAAKANALQGGSEKDLTDQLAQLGLATKFGPEYLHTLELLTLIQSRFNSQAEFDAALKKANVAVSVNRRYGSWNGTALTVSDLGSAQLPPNVRPDTTLPADVKPTQ
jgi:hypothetical protein